MGSILDKDKTKGLGQILREKYVKVPVFQRAYSWQRDKVDELFDDLRRAIENNRDYYFLGLIVGCQPESGGDEIEIVDGQQRLATSAILLSAIRNHFLELGERVGAGKFEEKYLFRAEGIVDPVPKPSISLSKTDDDYFQKRVIQPLGQPAKRNELRTPSHRLIDDAAKVASKFVRDQIAGSRKPREQRLALERWADFLRDNARVVFIVVNTPADAFMVFETLNDRGLDLTIADLAKNYLFMTACQLRDKPAAEKNLEDSIGYWDTMTTTLATASESAERTKVYIHHLWSSHNGVTRDKELFKDLRDRYQSPAQAMEFTRLLCDSSGLYAALGNSDSSYWTDKNVKRHLAILNTNLKATQIRMLLLAAIECFPQPEYEEIIKCSLWWSVRFLVAGGTPSKWESHYASRAKAIRAGTFRDANALIQDMAHVIPSNEQFQAAFAEFSPPKAVSRYCLNCLEDAKLKKESPHLAIDDPTLADREHILPENPDPTSWPHLTRDDHERLKDRLGNHALLTPVENKARKNGGFADAKVLYSASSFLMTKMLAEVTGDWNEAEIDKRQQEMAEMAVGIWPIRPTPKRKKGR